MHSKKKQKSLPPWLPDYIDFTCNNFHRSHRHLHIIKEMHTAPEIARGTATAGHFFAPATYGGGGGRRKG